jgi:hypothetical protein
MKGGNPKNLKRSTPEQARKNGALGGKKSAAVKKERKLMSQIYAEILADKSKIDIEGDGKLKEMTGEALVKEVSKRILLSGGSPAVSLIKELREGPEGSKVTLDGDIGVTSMTPDQRKKRLAELEAKHAKK